MGLLDAIINKAVYVGIPKRTKLAIILLTLAAMGGVLYLSLTTQCIYESSTYEPSCDATVLLPNFQVNVQSKEQASGNITGLTMLDLPQGFMYSNKPLACNVIAYSLSIGSIVMYSAMSKMKISNCLYIPNGLSDINKEPENGFFAQMDAIIAQQVERHDITLVTVYTCHNCLKNWGSVDVAAILRIFTQVSNLGKDALTLLVGLFAFKINSEYRRLQKEVEDANWHDMYA
ncbi:hypothetical protein HDU81_000705, partial [Chytriomyces hyalinus]